MDEAANQIQPEEPAPDVPLQNLIVFETPDILIGNFTSFGTSDPPLAEQPQLVQASPPAATGRRHAREWIESLVSTVLFVLLFTTFVAQATQVPTESMKPTILVGDHFFLDKVAFPGNFPASIRPYLPERSIQRGDIIAFKSPVDEKIPFVKRVIGAPGDTLEIRQKQLFINGKQISEPYKIYVDASIYERDSWTPEELAIRDNYGPVTVPANSFFVMGDNRDNSNDSRYWGFVSRDSVIGKPLFVYWSYESDPYVGGTISYREWMMGYVSVAQHFFSRTRWFRIGTIVR